MVGHRLNVTNMNKSQLVEAVMLESGIGKVEARKAVDAMTTVVAQALREEDKVVLSGLGVFSVQHRPARTGRNPRTGAAVKIPPKRAVKFRPTVDIDE